MGDLRGLGSDAAVDDAGSRSRQPSAVRPVRCDRARLPPCVVGRLKRFHASAVPAGGDAETGMCGGRRHPTRGTDRKFQCSTGTDPCSVRSGCASPHPRHGRPGRRS